MYRGSSKFVKDANKALLTLNLLRASKLRSFQLNTLIGSTGSNNWSATSSLLSIKISLKPAVQRCVFSTTQLLADSNISEGSDSNECHGQPLHRFGSSHSLSTAANRFDQDNSPTTHYQQDMPTDKHVDVYNHDPSVNLSACMQSQVPEPYGKMPTHMNMPGGVSRREVSVSHFLIIIVIL